MRVDLALLGYAAIEVEGELAAALFEMLRAERFSPKGLKRCAKTGKIRFFLTEREAARFCARAKLQNIPFSVKKQGGVPLLLRRLGKRPGLLLGLVLALALFLGARSVLWEIEITGNDRVSKEEIEQELELAGLWRGRFLPHVDADEVALALRRADSRMAYVGVNVVGTVAYVQVRESEPGGEALPVTPANLVAKCDGVVTLPLIFEGQCLVREGDVVRAGDLLAGGVIDTQNHGYRVTRAAGQVLARTVQTYTVRVPFADTEKSYTGKQSREISLFFFHSGRKVFKSTGKSIDKCDIIEKMIWFHLPGGKRLPFGIAIKTAVEYTERPVTRTALQAREMALEELERMLAADSVGRTLLQRTLESSVDADGITLVCTVVCETDIAKTVEFTLEP